MTRRRPRNPAPPSHLTLGMVQRHLAALGLVLSTTRVWELSRPGRPLETETHDGTRLVPRWRLMEFVDARGLIPAPGEEAAHG